MNSEWEVEDWFALQECLGGEPSCSLTADVSGRCPGEQEVFDFVTKLLRQFQGVAEDDYYYLSQHFWTLEDLEQGTKIKNHPFFDYNGWYYEEH